MNNPLRITQNFLIGTRYLPYDIHNLLRLFSVANRMGGHRFHPVFVFEEYIPFVP